MTDPPTPPSAKRERRVEAPPVAPAGIPESSMRLNERIMRAVINGDVSHNIERKPATTLAGLPTAIDDAIDIAKEPDVALMPVDVRLMRSLGKRGTLSVSKAWPPSGVGKAR